LIFLGLLPLLFAAAFLISVAGGAPFVGSPKQLFPQFIELANLKPDQTFLEMGSGIGDLLLAVRKTGANIRGVEISPPLYAVSKWRLGKKANIQLGSVYDADIANVDVVYCYLLSPMMKRLEKKFEKELKPGSKVVSFAFPLPNKQPAKIIPKQGSHGRIFLYTY
jgi:SAM-dependent methyltransferase